MERTAAIATLLAVSVMLAGCGFLGGQQTDVEETPDEATPTATPAPFGGAETPPGVGTDGVTDVDDLVAAHSAELNGTPLTVAFNSTLVVNGERQSSAFEAKVLPDQQRGWLRAEFADGEGIYYTAGGTTYFREIVNGSVDYGTTDGVSAVPERPRFGLDDQVRTALRSADWEPVGTVERDGETLLEFRATNVDPPDVDTSGNTTVRSGGRLLVDQRGVVHHVSVSTTVENDRGTVRYVLEVETTDVGSTTVDEPSWLDNAD
jgi:hypothetical protein